MALYEHVFIARQDLSQQQVDALVEHYKGVISANGGAVGRVENWGLKSLTYRVKKNRKAYYTLIELNAPAKALNEMERQMGLSEDILRFLTVKVDAHEEGPSAMLQKRDRDDRGDRGGFGDRDRGARPDRGDRPDRGADRAPRAARSSDLTASEAAEVSAARGSLSAERADLEASEASPEALAAGQAILEELMRLMDLQVTVEVQTGDTSRLNVVGEGEAKEALGALIGRKGERLSALQHLVNLMLSKKMGDWTRVLVDVEDYRGRRERQLRDLATRAAERVAETGKMPQLEPMPALERRWVHIALRENPNVATQSIGEEPNRRIVVLPRNA